ncbi:MAG: C40 family peptidase [Flavobacteriaceae bacterium]|nr:C40 family peptidase [Flavobacteriaceae bacterium]
MLKNKTVTKAMVEFFAFLKKKITFAKTPENLNGLGIATILLIFSCNTSNKNIEKYISINDSIKKEYAPDKRVAIYNVSLISKENSILLKGESNQVKAIEILKQKLSDNKIQFIDSIDILPNKSVGNFKYAVVNNSVANIRSKPKHSAELATQALLGTGMKVLKIQDSFYLIQVADGYISWVDHGGVVLMNEADYINWTEANKVIYTKTVGNIYQEENEDSTILSDIVLGAQLKILNQGIDFFKVEYPDKRIGYIKNNEAELYSQWIQNVQPSGELIEKYARNFLGSPYLWGGTSTKGMDCSGFTKTVYLLNGFIIPRDASQQIHAGETVDKSLKFENLEKGDLMFFGTKATTDKKQRVTHVGIWLGNRKGEFIHSAKQVRLSSIYSKYNNYDEDNTKRYLGSKRYLGKPDKLITNLKTDKILTHIRP